MSKRPKKVKYPDINKMSVKELRRETATLAERANSRLRRLEKAGYTGGAYKSAKAYLGERKSFHAKTRNLPVSELRREYANLRSFLSMKTSTVSGVNEANRKRFNKAVSLGFDGTEEEFITLIEQLYIQQVESLYSSDVIYRAITSGTTDILMETVEKYKDISAERGARGRALIEYLRRKKK